MIFPSDGYESAETVRSYPYRVVPPPSSAPMPNRNRLRIDHWGPTPRCYLAPRTDTGVRSRDCFPYAETRERFWEDFEHCMGPGCADCPRAAHHESRKDPPGRLRARYREKMWWLQKLEEERWVPFESPYRTLREIVMTWKVQRGPHRRDEMGPYIPLVWAQTVIKILEHPSTPTRVLRLVETTVFEDPPLPFRIP